MQNRIEEIDERQREATWQDKLSCCQVREGQERLKEKKKSLAKAEEELLKAFKGYFAANLW